MHAPSGGKHIEINKRELDTLLAFAGDDEARAVVHFRIQGGKLLVGATGVQHAVLCEAEAEPGAEEGEWQVPREQIEKIRDLCFEGSPNVPALVARFIIKKTMLAQVHIVELESGKRVQTDTWEKNTASSQVSIDGINQMIPPVTKTTGSWFAFVPNVWSKLLNKVWRVTDKCPVTLYPPQDNIGLVNFEASCPNGSWRGVLKPVPTQGPGMQGVPSSTPDPDDDSEDGDEGGEEPKEDPQNPKPLELQPTEKPKRGARPKLATEKAPKAAKLKPRKPTGAPKARKAKAKKRTTTREEA